MGRVGCFDAGVVGKAHRAEARCHAVARLACVAPPFWAVWFAGVDGGFSAERGSEEGKGTPGGSPVPRGGGTT